ncbi:dipicolinate synthase subunit DpsA [Clostridium sp. Cult1]|uniref:dipicolinate synthase subunit DpsA n=1 Tax=Clostridium sp. Cult1 TaxID=2079002 RepID=UPI001F268CB6|nr:dipicolinate synthase subunit DpsA [Clostridium sp. Cult1]MCF6461985.1 dihydrofolate reductase [Clostridium sp. Cult1]
MKVKKFMILGGDNRNIELANLLYEDGHHVSISHIKGLNFKESDIIIGPLPFSKDNKTVNAPFHTNEIPIEIILENIKNDQLLIAGKIEDEHRLKAKDYGIDIVDYFDREELQVLNAIPTVEGAIKLAIDNSSITLHSSNVLILGFGRIGKVLAKMLYGIGANVHIAARKHSDIAWIKNLKYKPIWIGQLDEYINNMDFVFNTIPFLILTKDKLKHLHKNTLIIDLASQPGGVDFIGAKELGIKVIHALGLPGKVAPITAAKIVKETIYNIIEERGI